MSNQTIGLSHHYTFDQWPKWPKCEAQTHEYVDMISSGIIATAPGLGEVEWGWFPKLEGWSTRCLRWQESCLGEGHASLSSTVLHRSSLIRYSKYCQGVQSTCSWWNGSTYTIVDLWPDARTILVPVDLCWTHCPTPEVTVTPMAPSFTTRIPP